jgi:hypothetical protein
MSSQIDLSLHYKQTVAYESPATEILYGGAKGGGKSHLFRAAAILWASQIPGLQVYVFRRTSPDLWKNHMQGPGSFPALLGPWIRSKLVSFNGSKMYFEFWNGSQISLCHCQYEKDLINYQGAEIHVLMIDELTQWLKDMYQYLRGQVRLGGLKISENLRGLFPRILCGANPGGIGHNWVKRAFIDMVKPLEVVQMDKKEGGLRRQFIPALLEDNPTLLANDPDYEDRLEGMGSASMVKAMRWGIWDIVAGGAVDDLWEPDKQILPSFEIPPSWWIDRSFDWGSSHPFSVNWWAESDGTEATLADGTKRTFPPGSLFGVNEFYGWNGNPNEGCKMLAIEIGRRIKEIEKEVFRGRHVKPGPADSSIFDSQNGVCIADDMAKAGVTWTRADKSPGSRKTGLEVVRRLLKASLSWPMEEPGLFVMDNCRHFIRTIPVLPRDERQPDTVDTNAEDHIFDSLSYRARARKLTSTSMEFLI